MRNKIIRKLLKMLNHVRERIGLGRSTRRPSLRILVASIVAKTPELFFYFLVAQKRKKLKETKFKEKKLLLTN